MTSGSPTLDISTLAKALGITRIADVTGLDVAGIPVVQAVRPFSLSNAVSQGKGPTLEAAAMSAVFESAESFAAERLSCFETTFASCHELGISGQMFEPLVLDGVSDNWRETPLRWISARNLLSGRDVMVPFELVHTSYTLPLAQGDGVFSGTTTGLAAAFRADDATAHGLLECVERDAVAKANSMHGFFQRCRIDPDTIDDATVRELLEKLRERGFLVGLWHAESPAGIPVVWCHLMEACEPQMAVMPFPGEGTAARFQAASAVCHAIYEAAQSRLTAISGARDDFTRRHYPKYPDWQMLLAHGRLVAEGPRHVHFHSLQAEPVTKLQDLLGKLEELGHPNVIEVKLDHSAVPKEMAVRKIIVPSFVPFVEG